MPAATDPLHDEVASRLRRAEQRYTRGRRRLIEVLGAGEGPLTIPQILDGGADLAQSSVYRNLTVLEAAGVVTRIVTQHDFASYELAEDLTGHHHHLICSSCGEVSDFSLPPAVESQLEAALDGIGRANDFGVDAHRLDLVGRCATCR